MEAAFASKEFYLPFLNVWNLGLKVMKEHQLEAATVEAVSSRDSWVSLEGQELKGNFGEDTVIRGLEGSWLISI